MTAPMQHLLTSLASFLFPAGSSNPSGRELITKDHYDVPMRACTGMLDDSVIIDTGRLLDEKIVVGKVTR